jgi:hypothetical protein
MGELVEGGREPFGSPSDDLCLETLRHHPDRCMALATLIDVWFG